MGNSSVGMLWHQADLSSPFAVQVQVKLVVDKSLRAENYCLIHNFFLLLDKRSLVNFRLLKIHFTISITHENSLIKNEAHKDTRQQLHKQNKTKKTKEQILELFTGLRCP